MTQSGAIRKELLLKVENDLWEQLEFLHQKSNHIDPVPAKDILACLEMIDNIKDIVRYDDEPE